MPSEPGMRQQQQGDDVDVAAASLTASNAVLGSGSKAAKRLRGEDAAEGAADAEAEAGNGAATQQLAAPEGQGAAAAAVTAAAAAQEQTTTMHLRSAQKRLLAAEAAARADSGVGSSQQLDRTDSCGGPRRSADPLPMGTGGTAAAAATAVATAQQQQAQRQPIKKAARQQQQQQQKEGGDRGHGSEQAAAEVGVGAAATPPPAKRRRVARAGVPAPLPSYELTAFDRDSPPLREDDENGHYVFEIGENLAPRFKIMRKFGEGTFGQVLECWDRKRKDYVAVKIIRNIQKYRDAAMIELEALNTLAANDPGQSKHCVQLLEWFNYRGHVCMVFERLGPSLYDFLRRNGYKPFPLAMARAFARQLLESVQFMHELQLVHTDLKPENILMLGNELSKEAPPAGSRVGKRLPATPDIRVIDFGSATFNSDYHSSIVSTRHYRAPEVILGLGWSFPCDIWSVGCILVELLSGDALFQTHENLEHLAMMEAVLGPIPPTMAAAAADNVKDLFKRSNRLNWPEGADSKKSVRAVQKLKKMKDYLRQHCEEAARQHLDTIVDLLRCMLEYRASERITAAEALRHPFFQLQL